MKYVYDKNNSKVDNGMSFLQRYCKGFKDTIDYSEWTEWIPESKAIIQEELAPQVEKVEEIVNKIVQVEEQAVIDCQLYEKPVADIKVETEGDTFIIKDKITGAEISRGDVKVAKGYLNLMYELQHKNSTTTQAVTPEIKQPIAEDTGKEPF